MLLLALVATVPATGRAQRTRPVLDFRRLALAQQRPFAPFSLAAMTTRDSIVAFARAQVGRRYRLGGTSPDRGFDCSGLVKYVLGAFEVRVPRTSREQSRAGAAISRDRRELRPGDLLLFGKARDGVSHVGIYVGNGRFIHASSVAGRVIESSLNRPPSPRIKAFQSARRVFDGSESTGLSALLAARGQ
jgi:cell wall-associated NlpC family hydrolase